MMALHHEEHGSSNIIFGHFDETIDKFISNFNAFSYMRTDQHVKGNFVKWVVWQHLFYLANQRRYYCWVVQKLPF